MAKKGSKRRSDERKNKERRNRSRSSSSSFYSSSSLRDSESMSSHCSRVDKKKSKKQRKISESKSDLTEQREKSFKNREKNKPESKEFVHKLKNTNEIGNVSFNNDIDTKLESRNGINLIPCSGNDENKNNHDIYNIHNNLFRDVNNKKSHDKLSEEKSEILSSNFEKKSKKHKKDKHRKKDKLREKSKKEYRERNGKKSKKEKKSKHKYSDKKRKRSNSSNNDEGESDNTSFKKSRIEINEKKTENLEEEKNNKENINDLQDKNSVNLIDKAKTDISNETDQKKNDETSLLLKADLEKEKQMLNLAIRNKLLGYVDENAQALEVYKHYKYIDINNIPNVQKKVVIFNLPPNINDDEINEYFYTLLLTLNPDSNKNSNPIVSIEKCDDGYYYIFELETKDDIEILMNMDQTDWRGFRIRIQKPRRFFTDYNDTQGNNAKKRENKKNTNLAMESDNKLYMGGIPLTAKEHEVRELVESFGQLKLFNLVKDPNNEDLNRGFCFFEYLDEKVTERALKGLNNIDMADRKLRVQRATINNKSFTILQQMKTNPVPVTSIPGKSNFSDYIPTVQPHQQVDVPIYAALPSRVIQMINMINPEDVMDDLEYREIVEDIRNECMQYGTVLNVEIPRPDKNNSIAGPAVGKIFVKFSTLQSAKKARFKLSGKKYNRRTCVVSFYPENYFDVREFNFHER